MQRTPKPQISASAKRRAIREQQGKIQSCTLAHHPQSTAAKKAVIRERRAQSSSAAAIANVMCAPDQDEPDSPTDNTSAFQVFAPPASSPECVLESLTGSMQALYLPDICDTSRYFSKAARLASIQPAVLLQMFETLVQSLFKGMPQTAAGMSLAMSKLVENASLTRARGSQGLTQRDLQIIRDMPKDIRTVYRCFDLDPQIMVFATCPEAKCCAVYQPIMDSILGITHYPPICTRHKFGKVCNTPLTKQAVDPSSGISVPVPLRPFPYRPFRDHLASMLSQSGIEKAIRDHMHEELEHELRDIIGSPALKGVRDPSGLPFLRDCGSELRLVWALCVDWYNPLMNKIAGKAISVGVIALICLSLPPRLRLLEHNIYYCGPIPGTQEPALDANNNFLDPAVTDLQVAYDHGVYLTRTHDHPTGRNTRSVVVPVIADTLASKKITGRSNHRGKFFCSHCRLRLFEINNLDPATWPRYFSRAEHEEIARRWLNAATQTEQKNIFTTYGIRWSSLLNLAYHDPALAALLEAVHVLFLGLIPRHCRDMLGLSIKDLQDQDDEIMPRVMQHARKALATRTRAALRALSMDVLKALCVEQKVTVCAPKKGRRKKADYIEALLGYNSPEQSSSNYDITSLFSVKPNSEANNTTNPPPVSHSSSITSESTRTTPPLTADTTIPPLMTQPSSAESEPTNPTPPLTKQDLLDIRRDIAATIRPTWQAHLPENFGCAEHGKLKADQWRTALEFDIPVSLVRILAKHPNTRNIARDMRARRIVEHTLDLSIAIAWGASRRTSHHHAERYSFYMARYIAGIHELYPGYDLKPKHHYALHVPDVLLRFGPLHGVWAYGLERLIGRLQKLNTNYKNGELELTVMKTICRRSNLICFLSSNECPALLKDAWVVMQEHLDLSDLGSVSASKQSLPSLNSNNSKYGELDVDIYHAFATLLSDSRAAAARSYISREVLFHSRCHQDGVLYTDFHTNLNHSIIYFRHNGDSRSAPAQIRSIFTHKRRDGKGEVIEEVFLAIHEYLPADNTPFAPFPDFRAAIFHREPAPDVQVICSKQLHCHANQRPWDHATVVMRAIDRVRYPKFSGSVLL